MDFWGYVRENGKVGARNYVAVVPTVVCAAEAAQAAGYARNEIYRAKLRIADMFDDE